MGDYDFPTVTTFEKAVDAYKWIGEAPVSNHRPMYVRLTPLHEISSRANKVGHTIHRLDAQ